jgi:hypothetical protein
VPKAAATVAEHIAIIFICLDKGEGIGEGVEVGEVFVEFFFLGLDNDIIFEIADDHSTHSGGGDGLAHHIVGVDLQSFEDKLFVDRIDQ